VGLLGSVGTVEDVVAAGDAAHDATAANRTDSTAVSGLVMTPE
jgi:hypothetical protein